MHGSNSIPPRGPESSQQMGDASPAENPQQQERTPSSADAPQDVQARQRETREAARHRPGENVGRDHSHRHHRPSQRSGRATPGPSSQTERHAPPPRPTSAWAAVGSLLGFRPPSRAQPRPESRSHYRERHSETRSRGAEIERPSGPAPERQQKSHRRSTSGANPSPAEPVQLPLRTPDRRDTRSAKPEKSSSSSRHAPRPATVSLESQKERERLARQSRRMSTSIPIEEEEETTFEGRRQQDQPKRPSLKKDSRNTSGPASDSKGKKKAVDTELGDSSMRPQPEAASHHARFGKKPAREEVFSYKKPRKKYEKNMYGDPKEWAKRMRAADQAGGTSSSNVSSVGGQIGHNKKLIYTEINAGRLSTGLQEFLDADDQEEFRVGGPGGLILLEMPEEDLWAQLERWSNEDYHSNEEFVRAGSEVLDRLFARPNMIFDREEQDAYLRMRPAEFQAFAGSMEANYNAIRNSALHQRNLSILTSERQARLIQLSSEDLASALERWNANYTVLNNRGFFLGGGAQYYSTDDITEILDMFPEDFNNWSNQFYGEPDEPGRPDMQGAAVSAQSRPEGNENRSINEAFIRAESSGQDLRNRLFGRFSPIFSQEERDEFLNLPPVQFQALVRRVEENYPVIGSHRLNYRRFLTPERQARLVQLPGEELASTLQRWLENYDALSTELSFFVPGGRHEYYSSDQITGIIDMTSDDLEDWIEQWSPQGGARLR